MKNDIQMIVQYHIKDAFVHQYQQAINDIIKKLPTFDAQEFQYSYSESDPSKIIETYMVPTESHYYALKKLRKNKSHSVFGSLDELIHGGLQQMECCALKKHL
ncbi:hypothetical protein LS684_03935 [Cytobacillus spongiae]|jgi:hypothetical protein|uniref:hypothetical protein n=1 Tax=Cytobacillus spongiae TaxID=2901381 RepID=UPI001F16A62F|nr:hypothetical protein [Cytobacillus spongiae]UII56644.1 hypothetical protein LS684_03935 [Cytobacillus spongiae]